MNILEKLEQLQERRVVRLERIARQIGRQFVTVDDPLIEENVTRAKWENNESDAYYWSK